MSIKLMSAIFETEFPSTLPDSEGNGVRASTLKVVLLAIADHANDEGESAYPGLTRLELKTGLSRQGIISALDALKFSGIISVDGERSKLNTNSYTVNLGCFPCLVNHVDQHGKIVNRVTSNGQQGLPLLVNRVDLNSTLTVLNPSEEKTPLKGIEQAILQNRTVTQEDINASSPKYKQLCERVEKLLKVTPNMSNPKWETVLNGIEKREKLGQSLDNYARWCKEDKFNSPKTHQIAKDPHCILDTWVAAFADEPYRDPRMKEWHDE